MGTNGAIRNSCAVCPVPDAPSVTATERSSQGPTRGIDVVRPGVPQGLVEAQEVGFEPSAGLLYRSRSERWTPVTCCPHLPSVTARAPLRARCSFCHADPVRTKAGAPARLRSTGWPRQAWRLSAVGSPEDGLGQNRQHESLLVQVLPRRPRERVVLSKPRALQPPPSAGEPPAGLVVPVGVPPTHLSPSFGGSAVAAVVPDISSLLGRGCTSNPRLAGPVRVGNDRPHVYLHLILIRHIQGMQFNC
jgi:hypothetical protein